MVWDDDDGDTTPLHRRKRAAAKPRAPKTTNHAFADDTNWREKIQAINSMSFDDAAKQRYINSLIKYGKRNLAAAAAGVTERTVKKHMSVDPEFDEAVEHALGWHRENRAKRLELSALNGYEETIIGANGEMATRKRYETQLRVLMLKGNDKDLYSDAPMDVNLAFKGGALIIPATLNADEWEKQFDVLREASELPASASSRISEEVRDAEYEPVPTPK